MSPTSHVVSLYISTRARPVRWDGVLATCRRLGLRVYPRAHGARGRACGAGGRVRVARALRLYLTCNFRGREDLDALTCSALAAACVRRGGGEAPSKLAWPRALFPQAATHTHWLTRKPSSLTPTPLARSRSRVCSLRRKTERGVPRLCAVPFVGSGPKWSSLRRRKARGRRSCAQFLSSGRAKPTSLRRKKEGGRGGACV